MAPKKYIIKTEKNGCKIKKVRQWLLTNSFNNNFIHTNKINLTNIKCIKTVIYKYQNDIINMLEYESHKFIKENIIIVLILLSNGNFKSKKAFKKFFPFYIQNVNDLFLFFHHAKRMRGIGSLIKNTVKEWLTSKLRDGLEKELCEVNKNYGWSMKNIIKLIRPNPENIKERAFLNLIINEDYEKHKKEFPFLYIKFLMRKNKLSSKEISKLLESHKINFSCIPSNVKITKEIIITAINNMNDTDFIFLLKRKLLQKFISDEDVIDLILKKLEEIKKPINIILLLTLYEKFLNLNVLIAEKIYDILVKRVKFIENSFLHIVDTDPKMLDYDLNKININGAKIASVYARTSSFAINTNGIKFNNSKPRSILEAEGFSDLKIDYNKVFEKINELRPSKICLWIKNHNFINNAIKKFIEYNKTNRQSKLVIINLNDKTKNLTFKDNNINIYTINKFNLESIRILNLIEEEVI